MYRMFHKNWEYKAFRVEQPLHVSGWCGSVLWMADVLSVHYVTARQN